MTPRQSRARPTAVEPVERIAFSALARCFLAATEAIQGPDVRSGVRGALVYGAAALDLPGLSRVMTADADRVPAERDIDSVLVEVSFAPAVTWWIPPGPAAAEIEATIAGRGFVVDPGDDSAPGMWITLDALPEPALAAGVTIEVAGSVAAVREANLVAAAGFGLPEAIGAGLADLLARTGDQPASASRTFVARLNGRRVATALAVVDRDAAVIYNVATLPDARGLGIGGAVTLAALRDAQTRGAVLGVLESSEMGYGVYRRLGSREAGRFRILVRRRSPVQPG